MFLTVEIGSLRELFVAFSFFVEINQASFYNCLEEAWLLTQDRTTTVVGYFRSGVTSE